MHAPRAIFADPSISVRRTGFQVRLRVRREACTRRSPIIGVVAAGHGDIFRPFGLHVEIPHDQEILRQRRIGNGEFNRARQGSALVEISAGTILQEGNLCQPLVRRDMIEMNGVDAQSTAGSVDHGLQRTSLQVQLVEGPVARQKQIATGADRITRQHHVTKLEAPLAQASIHNGMVNEHVTGRTEGNKMGRKQRRKGLDEIRVIVPAITAGDFLQRNHVRVADAVGNAIGVESPVLAEAVLDVVAHELHDTL